MLKELVNDAPPKEYSQDVKDFACTLMFYSPRAYDFVRNSFQLPCVSSIRRWTSNVKALPGFTKEAFDFLKQKCQVEHDDNFCFASLVIDGMSIQEHVEFDNSIKRTIGYVDLDCFGETDSDEIAKEALVVLLVGLRGHWKIPVAYYFVKGVSATLQAGIIREVIVQCHSFGLLVTSVTCDGTGHNLKTMNILGAQITSSNLKPFFDHPCDSSLRIGVFLDPCHMFKLIRNLLHKYQVLKWSDCGMIRWDFIKKLNDLQESHGLVLANKVIHFIVL